MHCSFTSISKSGFSLLEVTVVMFIMGLTITALLQLFQWGFVRYALFSEDWQKREFFSEMRIWLRHEVATDNIGKIKLPLLPRKIIDNTNLKISKLSIKNYSSNTVFITMNTFYDKNKNGKAENNEKIPTRLFCFNQRSAQ